MRFQKDEDCSENWSDFGNKVLTLKRCWFEYELRIFVFSVDEEDCKTHWRNKCGLAEKLWELVVVYVRCTCVIMRSFWTPSRRCSYQISLPEVVREISATAWRLPCPNIGRSSLSSSKLCIRFAIDRTTKDKRARTYSMAYVLKYWRWLCHLLCWTYQTDADRRSWVVDTHTRMQIRPMIWRLFFSERFGRPYRITEYRCYTVWPLGSVSRKYILWTNGSVRYSREIIYPSCSTWAAELSWF